jgi:hypothetical protein
LKRNRRAIQNKGLRRPRPYDKKTYQYADDVKKSLGVVYKRLMDASVIKFCLQRVRRAQECIRTRTQELVDLVARQIDADRAVTEGLLYLENTLKRAEARVVRHGRRNINPAFLDSSVVVTDEELIRVQCSRLVSIRAFIQAARLRKHKPCSLNLRRLSVVEKFEKRLTSRKLVSILNGKFFEQSGFKFAADKELRGGCQCLYQEFARDVTESVADAVGMWTDEVIEDFNTKIRKTKIAFERDQALLDSIAVVTKDLEAIQDLQLKQIRDRAQQPQ